MGGPTASTPTAARGATTLLQGLLQQLMLIWPPESQRRGAANTRDPAAEQWELPRAGLAAETALLVCGRGELRADLGARQPVSPQPSAQRQHGWQLQEWLLCHPHEVLGQLHAMAGVTGRSSQALQRFTPDVEPMGIHSGARHVQRHALASRQASWQFMRWGKEAMQR